MLRPSDDNNFKVVQQGSRSKLLILLGVVLAFSAMLLFAFSWGGRYQSDRNEQLEKINVNLRGQVGYLETENQQLLQRVAIFESAQKVDRLALENIRLLVRGLEDDKARLNEELTFYKKIIAPEDIEPGVRVHDLDLVSGDDARHYRFRLVISQVSENNRFLKGKVSVTIVGHSRGSEKKLSLFELAGLGSSSLPLGFRYFQELPESQDFFEFTLPEGFLAKSIQVAVDIRSGSVKNLNETFDWNKELVANVGQDQ